MEIPKKDKVDANSSGAKERLIRKYRDMHSDHLSRCVSVSYKDSQEYATSKAALNSMKAEIEGMK